MEIKKSKGQGMRADRGGEGFCTDNAGPFEKFLAWARTVPHALRNPLYHWTHLELQRYFGIDDLLNEETAASVWDRANRRLQEDEMTVHGILKKFHVSTVCTTDDPTDSLEYHEQVRASGISTPVFPTFRPDAAMRAEQPRAFLEWVERLGASANVHIARLSDFLDALRLRHDFFHRHGCRLSDHGLTHCHSVFCGDNEAAALFQKTLEEKQLSADELAKFASYMLLFFGRLDAEKGWTKQLHLGAYRNVNSRMLHRLGRDVGFDVIGDWPQVSALGTFMDRLESEKALPRMIIFNLNPTDNYIFAALASSFTEEGIRGKIQFGAGWWFLDQKEGIEWQINALSNCGLLSNFVGMVTDSRSFMSFPRHEYFRRVLCNLLGNEMETGLLPSDEKLVGDMVKDICLRNAVKYFRLPEKLIRPEAAGVSTERRG